MTTSSALEPETLISEPVEEAAHRGAPPLARLVEHEGAGMLERPGQDALAEFRHLLAVLERERHLRGGLLEAEVGERRARAEQERRIVRGKQQVLYRGGVFDLNAMRRAGISRADLEKKAA